MAVWRDRRAGLGLALMSRRFPPPSSVEEQQACFIARDASGQALAYVYFETNSEQRSPRQVPSAAITRGSSLARACTHKYQRPRCPLHAGITEHRKAKPNGYA